MWKDGVSKRCVSRMDAHAPVDCFCTNSAGIISKGLWAGARKGPSRMGGIDAVPIEKRQENDQNEFRFRGAICGYRTRRQRCAIVDLSLQATRGDVEISFVHRDPDDLGCLCVSVLPFSRYFLLAHMAIHRCSACPVRS